MQRLRNSFGDLGLNVKDVGQLPIISLGPNIGIGLGINQLDIDPHLIGHLSHATLKNVRHAKLLCDLAEIPGFALILLRRSAGNDFQIRKTSQPRQDLLLNAAR